ncbi:MAG: hypothetical protein HZA19_01285 [Nitrospirae bacterium]|nr:hypothetical protein [Nitrospirota bacterium]
MQGAVETFPEDLKVICRQLLDLSREAGQAITGEEWDRILEVLTRREERIRHLDTLRESGSLSGFPEFDAETKEMFRALVAEDQKNMERLGVFYQEAREAVSSLDGSRPVIGKSHAYRSLPPRFVDHKA